MISVDNAVVVGFVNAFRFDRAETLLSGFRGFEHIAYELRSIVAVVAYVEAASLRRFVQDARGHEMVEYVEQAQRVIPMGFSSYLPAGISFSSFQTNQAVFHKYPVDYDAGDLSRVCVIDTGMSPHPYLPASSFSESLASMPIWNGRFRGDQLVIDEVQSLAHEESLDEIYKDGRPRQLSPLFLGRAEHSFGTIGDHLWARWDGRADAWFHNARSLPGGLGSGHMAALPDYPRSEFISGSVRKISHRSWNYVGDTINVEDSGFVVKGGGRQYHGTAVAGLIAGACPADWLAADVAVRDPGVRAYRSDAERWSLGFCGPAPRAELVIAKCYDDDMSDESHTVNIQRALDRVCRVVGTPHHVDVVYIGLAIRSDAGGIAKASIAISKLIDKLESAGTAVVCPAGNDYGSGLALPAADEKAMAVGAVAGPMDSLFVPDYVNRPGPNEATHCSAFGGTVDQPALSTSVGGGMAMIFGTSVSGAIVAGLAANYISRWRISATNKSYEDVMRFYVNGDLTNLPTLPSSSRPKDMLSSKKMKVAHLREELRRRCTWSGGATPPSSAGHGLAQCPP